MADAAVSFAPSDLFNLGANFQVQQSSSDDQKEVAKRLEADGDIAEHAEFNALTKHSAEYEYGGTALHTDFTAKVGQVVNSIKIDQIRITLKQKAPVRIAIEGHNHGAHAHEAAGSGDFDGYDLDLDALIGTAQGAWGLPSGGKPWANANADASQVGLTLTFKCSHVDKEDHAGAHFAGESFDGEVEASAEYVGAPTLTTTGWKMSSAKDDEKVQDADSHTATGVKALARTVGS